jgi:hypothetical protein
MITDIHVPTDLSPAKFPPIDYDWVEPKFHLNLSVRTRESCPCEALSSRVPATAVQRYSATAADTNPARTP